MTSNDDKIIIGKAVETLQNLVADLELQIGEEGGSFSCALDATQQTLKDAVQRLETIKAG